MKKKTDERPRILLRYKNSSDPKTREKLIIKYLPLVRYVVDRLPVTDLPSICIDDLISSGVIGLLKALKDFNPQRGVKFQTYAIPRIRGAIIDELRSLDWIPRSLRKKAHQMEETYLSLERKFGRRPTDKELSGVLGIKTKELHQLRLAMTYFILPSLNSERDPETKSLMEIVPSSYVDDPFQILEKEEIKEKLKQVTQQLPDRERTVIILYYYEELTLKEIGKVLGVSESRISQIHSKAIFHLRAELKQPDLRQTKEGTKG